MKSPSPNLPPGHFWTTLPGLLTGLAALITAVTGFYVAVIRPRTATVPQTTTQGPESTASVTPQSTPASMDVPSKVSTQAPPAPVTRPAAKRDVYTVRMVGDHLGYRFEPTSLTARAGDAIRFILESGGPHNIAFDVATIPEDVKAQLQANMPNSEYFSSPMMVGPNEAWTLSLDNIKAGTYGIMCIPHMAMGMKMELIVQ